MQDWFLMFIFQYKQLFEQAEGSLCNMLKFWLWFVIKALPGLNLGSSKRLFTRTNNFLYVLAHSFITSIFILSSGHKPISTFRTKRKIQTTLLNKLQL